MRYVIGFFFSWNRKQTGVRRGGLRIADDLFTLKNIFPNKLPPNS